MAKFQFVEYEYIKHVITFEADSIDHAKELMDEAFGEDDLPNGEKYWKNGSTEWVELKEIEEN